MRPQEIFLQVKNAKKYGKKVALSTIYGPYEEFEKKARTGFMHYVNQILSITQIEYLKVLARAPASFLTVNTNMKCSPIFICEVGKC